ncbi:MAG: hypothetical protein ACREV7_20770 [Steroidobacteraceae bacterium]
MQRCAYMPKNWPPGLAQSRVRTLKPRIIMRYCSSWTRSARLERIFSGRAMFWQYATATARYLARPGIRADQRVAAFDDSTAVDHVDTYAIEAHDVYLRQPTVDTAVMAKTSLYSTELDRLYVSVPHLGETMARILIFKPSP